MAPQGAKGDDRMRGKRHRPEQIIVLLREAEVKLGSGSTIGHFRPETGHRRTDILSLAYSGRRHEGRQYEAPSGITSRERAVEKERDQPCLGHPNAQGGGPVKLLSPTRRRQAMEHLVLTLSVYQWHHRAGSLRQRQYFLPARSRLRALPVEPGNQDLCPFSILGGEDVVGSQNV